MKYCIIKIRKKEFLNTIRKLSESIFYYLFLLLIVFNQIGCRLKKITANNLDELKCVSGSSQVLIISKNDSLGFHALMNVYEKAGEKWFVKFTDIPAVLGLNGFAMNKTEGDGKSPMGCFSLGKLFARIDTISTRMDLIKTDSNDCWVDDPESEFYNTWQKGPANGKWKSGEDLYRYYEYAVSINFNAERIKGKGSAIFLHTWDGPDINTLGCVGISRENLLKLLMWLDKNKNPMIIMGTESFLDKMF